LSNKFTAKTRPDPQHEKIKMLLVIETKISLIRSRKNDVLFEWQCFF